MGPDDHHLPSAGATSMIASTAVYHVAHVKIDIAIRPRGENDSG